MRLKKPVLCFALFALMAAPVAAHADNMSIGPLTFGNTTLPFEAPGAMPAPVIENGVEVYQIQYFATSFGFGNGTEDTTYDMTYTSSFELAPGWSIVGMRIFNGPPFDSINPCDTNPDASCTDWGVEYSHVLKLCTASGACSTVTGSGEQGFSPLPPLNPDPATGPDTAVYELTGFSHNSGMNVSNPVLEIDVAEIALTPEPSTLVMLGTGALGLFGVVKRRLHA